MSTMTTTLSTPMRAPPRPSPSSSATPPAAVLVNSPFFTLKPGQKPIPIKQYAVRTVERLVPTKRPVPAVAKQPREPLPRVVAQPPAKKRKTSATTSRASSVACPKPSPSRLAKLRQQPRASSKQPRAKKCRRSIDSRSKSPTIEPVFFDDLRSRPASTRPASPAPPRDCLSRVECVRDESSFSSMSQLVFPALSRFKEYFHNPKDPDDTRYLPSHKPPATVTLQYPNTPASETFPLFTPKDQDLYCPIKDLEKTLRTILNTYISRSDLRMYGFIPDVEWVPAPVHGGAKAKAKEEKKTSDNDFWMVLVHAYRTRDGPLFQEGIHLLMEVLNMLKKPILTEDSFLPPLEAATQAQAQAQAADKIPNAFLQTISTWAQVPPSISHRIIEESWQRHVSPLSRLLSNYVAFSSTTYGELLPPFVSSIISATSLRPGQLFMDLGSGVGNVVLQVALEAGCESYGIEVLDGPARIAGGYQRDFEARCGMWGVAVASVELEHGDMLTSPRVQELLKRADVVLVNNKVFGAKLNAAISPMFLELKEGAVVVSLEPFVHSHSSSPPAITTTTTNANNANNNANTNTLSSSSSYPYSTSHPYPPTKKKSKRVTERNASEPSSILTLEKRSYTTSDGSGEAFSWSGSGGDWYLHRVDREGYARVLRRWEEARRGGGKGGRGWGRGGDKWCPSRSDD